MLVLWMHSQRQTYRFLTFARSLISFDHLRKTHTYLPPLTSIADNTDKSIADTAVSILLDKIKNSDSKFTGAVLPVTIYDGHTTGPVNKAFETSF